MSETRLNLDALRRNRLPRKGDSPLFRGRKRGQSPARFLTPSATWEEVALTRRNLFGVAAYAGLGLSPTVKAVQALLEGTETPFACTVTETRIAFALHGKERWVIDSRWFGGRPRLTHERSAGLIRIALADALFPGTRLAADFVCEIRRATLLWQMDLAFHLGSFHARVPFVPWLAEKEPATSPARLIASICELDGGVEASLNGLANGQFSPQWVFLFKGGRVATLHGFGTHLDSDSVRFALLDERMPSLVTRPDGARTLISFERGPRTWSVAPAFGSSGQGRLTCPDNVFGKVYLEAWNGIAGRTEAAVLAEGAPEGPQAWFHPAGFPSTQSHAQLPLVGARYLQLLGPSRGIAEQAFVADLGPTPVWLRFPGCNVEVGGCPSTPPFEMTEAPGKRLAVACEPAVHRIAVPMAGAIVEPMEIPRGARLNLGAMVERGAEQSEISLLEDAQVTLTSGSVDAPLLAQVQVAPPPKQLSPGQMQIQKMEQPAAIAGKVLIPKDFRDYMQVPAGAVSVLRPEDLLVLRFEFRGMTLQVMPGQPAKLVRAAGAPRALMVVHMQPQHIAEQAFYETQNPNAPDNELPFTKASKAPIKAQIAGWSHLVFDVPAQIGEIPYALPALLDWAHLTPVVAVAAAPPPPPPSPFLLGPHIFDKGGRLKTQMMVIPREVPAEGQPIPTPQSFPLPSTPKGFRWWDARESLLPFARARIVLASTEVHPVQLQPKQPIRPGAAQAPPFAQSPQAQKLDPKVLMVTPVPPDMQNLPQITAIEAPFRLFLSPSVMGGWVHALSPVNLNGRWELWHSRLGVRKQSPQGQWFVDEDDTYYRTMRAIWSPDYNQPIPLNPSAPGPGGPPRFNKNQPTDRTPFLMLPEAQHRHQLVHLMANARQFPDKWQERYAKVQRFMLSSLGAWIKLRYHADPTPDPAHLTVLEWLHIANMGRDQYVKVVEQGCLFPFGHKAVLLEVTERKFERTDEGIVAVLRYKAFIVVKEPVKNYPGPGQTALTFSDGRNFPYRRLQITTLITPNLDPKENSKAGIQAGAFWPKVSQQDFKWHLIGEDWAGQPSEFFIPLIYISSDVCVSAGLGSAPPIKAVRNHYVQDPRHTADLQGQKVAFAPPKPDGDTVLETSSLIFDAEVPCDGPAIQQGLLPPCPPQVVDPLRKAANPLFYPFVGQADVSIPAIKGLVGTGPASDKTKVRYNDLYRLNGFAGPNKGEVFLELLTPVGLRFGQTDKVGGVGTPNLDIVALSRSHGPVGGGGSAAQASLYDENGAVRLVSHITRVVDPKQAAADAVKKFADGKFDPKDFFKDAKILGGIPLGDIIGAVSDLGAGRAPKLITDRLPEEIRVRFEHTVTPLVDVLIFKSKLPAPVNKNASLLLKAMVRVKLPNLKAGQPPAPPEPQFNCEGEVQNFQLDFFGQLILSFKKFRFVKEHGKKADVSVALCDENKDGIKAVRFGGALAFIAKLQELIPSNGLSDPPNIEVTPTGVKAGVSLAIPSVTCGVLTLSNMKFGAGLMIPFTGEPVNLRVNFSTRNDPFMGAVWIFGVTGFFAIELNSKDGLALVEVQIEFGGMWAFDIGIASGGVKLVAGIYFKYEKSKGIFLEGYLKVSGCVSVLGIVTISLMIKLALQYSSADDKVWGEATVELKVEILFFEISVSYTCRKELAGSKQGGSAWLFDDEEPLVRLAGYPGRPYRTQFPGPQRLAAGPPVHSPKVGEMLSVADWNMYASAFAADAA